MGQWSEWGTCSRNNKTCGFKWGLETRTRQIVKKPAKDTIPCPTIAESRRCKMAMRHCPGGKCVAHARKIFMSWRPNSVSVLSAKAEKQQYYISPSLMYSETAGKCSAWDGQSFSRLWNSVFPGVVLRVFQRGALWKNHNRLQFVLQHGNDADGGRTSCSAHGRKDYDSKPLCRWCTGVMGI